MQYPREVGKANNAYGMKSTFRPGGRSIVKDGYVLYWIENA